VDLNIQRGEVVSIVGASGAGKSTLLQILGTLDRPDAGSILFDSQDIFKLNNAGLNKFRNLKIGFVFQFHNLLPEFTALENVMMPALIAGKSKEGAKKRALELMELLHVAERSHHAPTELSGGEQQRVAVARALVSSPDIILADEPTANLDSHTGSALLDMMKELNETKKITFVFSTHDQMIMERAKRLVILKDGRLFKDEVK